jgi:hypothetical protein
MLSKLKQSWLSATLNDALVVAAVTEAASLSGNIPLTVGAFFVAAAGVLPLGKALERVGYNIAKRLFENRSKRLAVESVITGFLENGLVCSPSVLGFGGTPWASAFAPALPFLQAPARRSCGVMDFGPLWGCKASTVASLKGFIS